MQFNPRPPLLAGDAAHTTLFSSNQQSFNPRLRVRVLETLTPGFNPRPPLLAGDAIQHKETSHDHQSFNPRPPLLAGDAPFLVLMSWAWMFQSAPAIAGGRCPTAMRVNFINTGFNPRPPLLAGDAFHATARGKVLGVSIRARHCWRAMRQRLWGHRMSVEFQSAPAIAGGRCSPACGAVTGIVPFQSAPAIAGGRCRTTTSLSRWRMRFQSAPAIAGGRCNTRRKT